jgi:hypothetical protein
MATIVNRVCAIRSDVDTIGSALTRKEIRRIDKHESGTHLFRSIG